MVIPIGLLVSLILVAFLLGLLTVPLVVLVILKNPARMQTKAVMAESQK